MVGGDDVDKMDEFVQVSDHIADKMKRVATAMFVFAKNSSQVVVKRHGMSPPLVWIKIKVGAIFSICTALTFET